jgi:hypothetical protein
MPSLFVECKVRIPMVGTWKWKQTDFAVPLTFQLSGVRASLFLDDFAAGMGDRQVVWDARLRFEYASPTAALLQSLGTSGKLAKELADTLYGQYLTLHEQLEGVLRTAGGVVNLPLDSPILHSCPLKGILARGPACGDPRALRHPWVS